MIQARARTQPVTGGGREVFGVIALSVGSLLTAEQMNNVDHGGRDRNADSDLRAEVAGTRWVDAGSLWTSDHPIAPQYARWLRSARHNRGIIARGIIMCWAKHDFDRTFRALDARLALE